MFVYNNGRTVKNRVIVLSCLVIPFSLWALLSLDFPRIHLLRFSQTCELYSSKAAFTIAFFAAVNYNYDHKQQT